MQEQPQRKAIFLLPRISIRDLFNSIQFIYKAPADKEGRLKEQHRRQKPEGKAASLISTRVALLKGKMYFTKEKALKSIFFCFNLVVNNAGFECQKY